MKCVKTLMVTQTEIKTACSVIITSIPQTLTVITMMMMTSSLAKCAVHVAEENK